MKKISMKGKTVEEAKKMALEVLGAKEEEAEVRIISEGRGGVLGIGGEEAEVEVAIKGKPIDEAKEILQNIMDKMKFLAVVEAKKEEEAGAVELNIKGEDIGRIIGKEGATLKALEALLGSILGKTFNERIRVAIDAAGYREKRKKSLERMASEIAEEVAMSGEEKILPYISAADRRIIHLYLQKNPKVVTFSEGEGKTRRLIIAPKK